VKEIYQTTRLEGKYKAAKEKGGRFTVTPW
jgi:hypothetical protein